jgi:hypothetical protein
LPGLTIIYRISQWNIIGKGYSTLSGLEYTLSFLLFIFNPFRVGIHFIIIIFYNHFIPTGLKHSERRMEKDRYFEIQNPVRVT